MNIGAANGSTKPLGDAWVLDRKRSPVDVGPLNAEIGAAWCLTRPTEKPIVSAYTEHRGLEVF